MKMDWSCQSVTWQDVPVQGSDICVSVRTDVLVVKAQSVKDFVLDGVHVQTAAGPQRHHLSSPLMTQVGPAPAHRLRESIHTRIQSIYLPVRRPNEHVSPTGPALYLPLSSHRTLYIVRTSRLVHILLPGSREEVEVVALAPSPPDEANAGGQVEGRQASNDDFTLPFGCRHKKSGC